ncbi:putative lysine/ornithine N-monooxygenase [Mycena kentingensis (nom. inval.)]|nr:putative lysine/ornithine N-monooxygenase [Mycena kentingensis (nom. inval.)]
MHGGGLTVLPEVTGVVACDNVGAGGISEYVGVAIRESGLARSEIYVTTKYSTYSPPPLGPRDALKQSLSSLGLAFADLYLIHHPVNIDIRKTWGEFEQAKKDGLVKSIGVSNFTLPQLKSLALSPKTTLLPAVNQIELHPYNYAQHKELIEWSRKMGIVIEAYSSLSSITKYPGGPVDAPVAAAAQRLGITPTQVLLLWVRAKGAVIVTTTSNPKRLEEYLAAGDLPPLPDADVAAIDAAGALGPPNRAAQRSKILAVLLGGFLGFGLFSLK